MLTYLPLRGKEIRVYGIGQKSGHINQQVIFDPTGIKTPLPPELDAYNLPTGFVMVGIGKRAYSLRKNRGKGKKIVLDKDTFGRHIYDISLWVDFHLRKDRDLRNRVQSKAIRFMEETLDDLDR